MYFEAPGTAAGFDVNKVGDARVGLVGFPSVGKSTLLTKLSGTMSEVGQRLIGSSILSAYNLMHNMADAQPDCMLFGLGLWELCTQG